MAENALQNLKIDSPSLGLIVIQPTTLDVEDVEKGSLILFPQSIGSASFNIGVEWAASTQTPIFCLPMDVARFEEEGFGAYRFHKIDGYREVDFQGGSIEFYPARKRRLKGIKGLTQEMAEWLGWSLHPGYHVLIRPRAEAPILYLASTVIDQSEWHALTKVNPQMIIGSDLFTKSEWHAFSTSVKRKVLLAQGLGTVKTEALSEGQSDKTQRENPLWAVKAGSL